MRNLKKILALVMALVMSMSLITIANAADFTDNDDISYEEAVDVMSTIGVINGMDDGSFDPSGTLTREQAAKLVTYMLLGDNAERLGIERSTFKDVAMTRWSAPAIEYCVSLGIIDGAGDGNFYPAGQLTGAAFAKVLLTAIGYDSQKEGLVGSAWSVNVSALAAEVGLDDGIEDLNWSAPLTREEAAQMALNAICAPLVTYENDATITVNGAEVSIASGDAYYVTTTLAKEQRISDRKLSNSNDYTVEFGEKYFPRLRLVRETDDFERPSHTWVYENTELGTYVDYDLLSETYTEAVTGRELFELLGRSTIDKYALTYYVDGVVVNDEITEANMIRGNNVEYGTTGNGVLTQVFVDHDDEEIIITSINTYLAQANSNYNEANETLSLKVFQKDDTGTTKIVDVADVANITDVTEDQFMLVNLSGKGLSAGVYDVVKVSDVEIMTDATVTKFSKSNGTKIASKMTVDGEEYSASQKAFYDKDVLDVYDQQLLTDMSYNIYLDQYGYAIGVDLYEGTKNYVFITGYDRSNSNISVKTAQAGAIFLDGTMSEITVNVTDTNKNIDRMDGVVNNACSDPYFDLWGATSATAGGKRNENRWYTYTENNGVYTLKPCDNMFATNLANGTVIKSAYVYLDDTVKNVKSRAYGNDDSVYITVEPGRVDTSVTSKDAITDTNGLYTGVQNVDIEMTAAARGNVSEANIYTLYDDDHYIIASIVLGEAQGSIANYAYILGNAKNEELRSDGYYYWEFDAVLAGEKVTLTAKTKYTSVFSGIRPYHVQELRYDGEFVTAVKDVDSAKIYTNNSVAINKQDVYDVGHIHTTGMDTGNGTGCTLGGTRIDGSIVLEGRTLYTTNAYGTRDVGLALAEDAKAVLVQYEGTSSNYMDNRTVSNCGSVSEAIGRLADRDTNTTGTQFKGRIVAVLNSAGVAQWVVIISDTPLIIGGGNVPVGPSTDLLGEFQMVDPTHYTVRYYGAKTLAQLQTYVIEVVERNTGMTVREYNPATGLLLFDGTIAWPVQVTTQRMAAFKIDGVVQQYVIYNHASTQSVTLPTGNYLVKGTVAGTPITGIYTVAANTMVDDIELVTAYSVEATNNTNGSARTTITYTDSTGTHTLTQANGAVFFAKGTVLTVKGQDRSNPAHGTFRRFEDRDTGKALSDYRLVAAGGNSMTYTVQENVKITESTNYVKLTINGTDYGYKPVDTTKVAATFMAPVDAEFALHHSLYTTGNLLSQASGKSLADLGNGAYTYTVRSDNHADANGIVNIVQAAKITLTGGSVTVNGQTAATGWIVAVGDTLNLSGVTSITVDSTSLAAGAPGLVTDASGNFVSYTVQAGDAAITIN